MINIIKLFFDFIGLLLVLHCVNGVVFSNVWNFDAILDTNCLFFNINKIEINRYIGSVIT